jgi:hypothetical protein
MSKVKRTLKHQIIQEFINCPHKTPYKIALDVGGKTSWVNQVIEEYKLERNLKLPLYIVKSIDLLNTYYLFTDTEEKIFSVSGLEIGDITNFTEYELFFLKNEKGFY